MGGGGGEDGSINVFDHLVTFNMDPWSIKKSYFLIHWLSGVTIAMSLSGSTRDFLKLSFNMFPYNEIFEVKSDLIFETSIPKSPPNTKFQPVR